MSGRKSDIFLSASRGRARGRPAPRNPWCWPVPRTPARRSRAPGRPERSRVTALDRKDQQVPRLDLVARQRALGLELRLAGEQRVLAVLLDELEDVARIGDHRL